MKVLILEPGEVAREADIEHTLEAMQAVVGGIITATYPYDDPVAVVANDEGLLIGMALNRKLDNYTVIAGPFFICGLSEDSFADLPDNLMEKYKRDLYYPQYFFRDYDSPSGVVAIPYDPEDAIEI